jgi:hypothetical protein
MDIYQSFGAFVGRCTGDNESVEKFVKNLSEFEFLRDFVKYSLIYYEVLIQL